ncbi:hypothetical protein OSB04_000489 [Centaurea solstitialis]|uniref:Uncharacterized protein n=1 Tax=Centaurea solstitialis TaxID=347529 RepID=A0AA38TP63_9ASTR|nr:hypothetical protein OSB04_000489 [Centaurea solstitialis]
MANSNKRDEPLTAPPVDRWFDLSLGSSFQDNPSSKFCTLRFTCIMIITNLVNCIRRRIIRWPSNFRTTNQGNRKSSEDYKDNDAVLFFDGSSFRLERLHRSVKRLRHVRQPGESAAAAAATSAPESSPPPLGKGSKLQSSNKNLLPPSLNGLKSATLKATRREGCDNPSIPPSNSFFASPDPKNDDDLDEQLDILNDDDEIDIGRADNIESAPERQPFTGIDINIPHQNETDDEIAEVDVSDDEGNKGPNAAEALRAQVNAEERKEGSSSSSDSSGSSSGSGSGSGSSSSSSSSGDSSDGDGDGDSVSSI